MLAVFFPLEFDLVFIGRDSSFVFLSFFFFFFRLFERVLPRAWAGVGDTL